MSQTKKFSKIRKIKLITITALYFFSLLIVISTVSAGNITINQLLDSYSYEYNRGDLKISSYTNTMVDTDSNSQNDTLILHLTFNTTNAGMYIIITDLMEGNGVISNELNQTLSSGIIDLNVSFSSKLLSQIRYNYTVRIYNVNDSLVYRKDRMLTDNCTNYETGISITGVSDQSINNDYLQINLTLNVTDNQTVNITGYLKYNESYISAKKEFSLSTGLQIVELNFDNETIKRTHYNSNYSLDYVEIGTQIFDTSYTTSSYNYEDFAKTSYLKSYITSQVDTNANNLSEYLRVNVSLEIKTSGTYFIDVQLYDLYSKFIVNASSSQSLNTGTQNIIIDINGTSLYASKIDGPCSLEYMKLSKSGETIDISYQPHTTGIYYYDDFEKPPLADLTPSINIIDNSTANVTVTNIGEIPASNILVDIFDDVNLSIIEPISYLNVSESQTILVNLSSNYSLFIVIVDFDNLIDESNESDNIQYIYEESSMPSLNITNMSVLYSNGTYKIFEFEVKNNGNLYLNNVSWALDLDDGNIVNGTNTTALDADEVFYIYFEYNYTSLDNYLVNLTVWGEGVNASETLYISDVYQKELEVSNLSLNYQADKTHIFKFTTTNNKDSNLNNVTWSLNTGEIIINSLKNTTLEPNTSLFIYVQCDYSAYGDYLIIASGTNGSIVDSQNISINVNAISVDDLFIAHSDATEQIFKFDISNLLNSNLSNVNWTLDSGQGMLNSTDYISLTPLETVFVFVDYNYTTTGSFYVNASAFNALAKDNDNITISIS